MEGVDESFASTFGNYILHGMNELVLPKGVSWLPQTLGWQILLFVLLLMIALRLASSLLSWYHNRYRSAALSELDSLNSRADRAELALRLPELLKSTALQAYPREIVAPLSGESWLAFLNNASPAPCFQDSIGQLLIRLSYQNVDEACLSDTELDAVYAEVRRWIQMHQTKVPSIRRIVSDMVYGKVDD